MAVMAGPQDEPDPPTPPSDPNSKVLTLDADNWDDVMSDPEHLSALPPFHFFLWGFKEHAYARPCAEISRIGRAAALTRCLPSQADG
jgi:hypothetical protein